MTERLGFIYGLADPRTDEIRYVGRAVNDPWSRYYIHIRDEADTHKCRWIRSLKASGLKPRLIIIEQGVRESEINQTEMWWIASGRSWGWALTNGTRGGDGLVEPTDEVRARMRKAWETRPPMSDDTRRQISERQRGKKHSESRRKKQAEAVVKTYDAGLRAKRSAQMRAAWADPERRAQRARSMSEAARRRWAREHGEVTV